MTIPADVSVGLPDTPAVVNPRPITLRAVADVETDAPNSVLGKV